MKSKPIFSFFTEEIQGMLTFFVISGKRESKDGTKFGQAACDQVFSIARFYVLKDGGTRLAGSDASMAGDSAFDAAGGGQEFKYHSFSCPQVSPLGVDEDNGVAGWMLAYSKRCSELEDSEDG